MAPEDKTMSEFKIQLKFKGSATTHERTVRLDDTKTDTEKMMLLLQASDQLIGDKVDIEYIEVKK